MITKPTLVLDTKKCKSNIEAMCNKAAKHNLLFRPHFKTHQSLEIGKWFAEKGVTAITTSSLEMAEYFSAEWKDITVAFPVNILEIETINRLAKKIQLNVLVQSKETANFLCSHVTDNLSFYIKIDVGTNRTGIDPTNLAEIDGILTASQANDKLTFAGFLAHAGHTYQCKNENCITTIHNQSIQILLGLKNKYLQKYPGLQISIGDTPGCSVAENFEGVDEIRPGNFVFYDLTQASIGSCTAGQIAVALACPVVALHPQRNEIIIYGGGIHFSKERLADEKDGTIYGRVATKTENGWGDIIPGMFVKSLSQEHGVIYVPDEHFNSYTVGDVMYILPVHSCMAVHAMRSYVTTDGQLISTLNEK